MTEQPADYLTVTLPNGHTWTRLDRLTDGRVMCCLCFGYVPRDQLATDADGQLTDVCQPCATAEARCPHGCDTSTCPCLACEAETPTPDPS